MATEGEGGRPAGIEFYGGYRLRDENGVDLTVLRANLRRSIEQRIEKNRQQTAFCGLLAGRKRPPSFAPPCWFDVPELIRQLLTHKVEFILGGGTALLVGGFSSAPQTLEIHYRLTSRNLRALAATLTPLHPSLRGAPRGTRFRPDVTLSRGLHFALSTEQDDFDLLADSPGLGGYSAALSRSEPKHCLGLTVRVLSLEAALLSRLTLASRHDPIRLFLRDRIIPFRVAEPKE